jgi:carboxymethylenebutenolidase
MPLVQELTPQQVMADVGACIRHLRGLGCNSLFTVGFCFGGSYSWVSMAFHDEVSGAVGFYGRPSRALPFVQKMRGPILALQGGADQGIPHEENLEFERALELAGVEYELVEFEGAPHSFFDRKHEQFQEASDDAWRRTLSFIETRI